MPLTTYTAGEVLTAASLNANFSFAATNGGLVLVKSQTIGTTVSSVEVTGAFSATYDTYKIVINGGVGSTNENLQLKLGSTTTGYYWSSNFRTWAGVATGDNGSNAASFGIGTYNTNTNYVNFDLLNPFNASPTVVSGFKVDPTVTGRGGDITGYLANTTSYSAFTFTPASGTITGGTIYVYGYIKS